MKVWNSIQSLLMESPQFRHNVPKGTKIKSIANRSKHAVVKPTSETKKRTKYIMFSNVKIGKKRRNAQERIDNDQGRSDEQFLVSLLPVFNRLRKRQNAEARIRIQQVLFEIEFGVPLNSGSLESREISIGEAGSQSTNNLSSDFKSESK